MRAIDQLQIDPIEHDESTERFVVHSRTRTVSAASSTPFARLKLVQKGKTTGRYEWMYEDMPPAKTYLHPLVNTKLVSEAIEDITEAFQDEQFEGLQVYLMESVRIEGIVLMNTIDLLLRYGSIFTFHSP